MRQSFKPRTIDDEGAFELVAVEQCEPPDDAPAGNWYQYTIMQGQNVITCARKGNKIAVTSAAREIVAVLNERRSSPRGRVHLIISRSKGKA